ncbi:transcriptional antiterminator [Tepidanaerobacter syntrophicus]|uniref:BglG family transcription antiterminator n=1 Tax=Tepidanaerobacter syntrophicus TaxID=224999 RepID=UPI0022EEB0E1|nr:PTS sugar transporter subunit IIA [Tepidanaerobacter syntrophicus]GLI19938.1 transcriptional antiterminator [Tepidanaerobacter syntrophicus]GLI51567.1 transcriptional antiterminator [Tepidanaerobacter syntrophicus]
MTLTEREKNLLILLLQHERLICSVIADLLQVSEKTVRNDIKKINANFGKKLVLSSRNGYFINPEYRSLLTEEVAVLPFQKEKNLKEILHYLFINNGSLFDDVADKFYISSSTLQQRLTDINDMIKSYSVKFIRKDAKIFIEGSEKDRQRLLAMLIQEEINNNFDTINDLEKFFPNIDVTSFRREVYHIIEEANYYVPEFYESNLLINLLSIFTFDANYQNQKSYTGKLSKDMEKIASNIADKFGRKDLQTPIQNSLTGVIKRKKLLASYDNLDEKFVNKIKDIILDVFERNKLKVDLKQFINVFSLHIYQLILRCRQDKYIPPQAMLSIKDSCFFIYDIAVQIADKLSSVFQIAIPEFEISLIAIHIGFAIEEAAKPKAENLHLNIAVFFENYTVIEENFLKNINKLIPRHSNCFIVRNAKELYELKNFDLLITTKNIDELLPYTICKISPFINENDIAKIKEAMSKIIKEKEFGHLTEMLSYYFSSDLFLYTTKIKNREEAFKVMAKIMKEKGIIDERFITSLYEREALSSTGFMNSFALPHSLEYNAVCSKIFALVNPESIKWGDAQVKIVFLIAISRKDREKVKPLFDFLTDIMIDEQKIYNLSKAMNFENFMQILLTK